MFKHVFEAPSCYVFCENIREVGSGEDSFSNNEGTIGEQVLICLGRSGFFELI